MDALTVVAGADSSGARRPASAHSSASPWESPCTRHSRAGQTYQPIRINSTIKGIGRCLERFLDCNWRIDREVL